MIPEDVWKKHFRDICFLIGVTNPPKEQGEIFYARLKHFEECDFIAACNDDGLATDLVRERLNMPTIKRYIEKHKLFREHAEHEAEKKKSAGDLKALYKNEGIDPKTKAEMDRFLGRANDFAKGVKR